MKLLLSNNQLTRYSKSGAYATTTAIPLDGDLAATASEVNHFRIYTINVTAEGTLQVQGAQNVAGSNSITATGFLKAERL